MDIEKSFGPEAYGFEDKKTQYFVALGIKIQEALKLHKSFGLLEKNLSGKREWGNVSEHCLVVAARTRALSKLAGLSEEIQNNLVLAAGIHDFYKKKQIEKTPKGVALSMQDYIDSEKEADEELTKAGISKDIINYIGSVGALPEAIYKIQTIIAKGNNASDEEIATLIIHYVDDYTMGSNWCLPMGANSQGKQINDLNRRIEQASNNPKYQSINEEGKKYFNGKTSYEIQEKVGEEVENFIAKKISQYLDKAIEPKELPTLVDQEIKKEIKK